MNNITPPHTVTDADYGKFLEDGCLICHGVTEPSRADEHNFDGRDVKKEEITKTYCNHLYHSACLSRWVNSSTPPKRNCALCNADISSTAQYLRTLHLYRLLKNAVDSNDVSEARRLVSCFPGQDHLRLLNDGLRMSLDESSAVKVKLWVSLGAMIDYKFLSEKLKEAVCNEDMAACQCLLELDAQPDDLETMCKILRFLANTNNPSLADELIYKNKDIKIRKVDLTNILNTGLEEAANEHNPVKAELWMRLGANNIDAVNRGLLGSAKANEPHAARKWMDLGADNTAALNLGLQASAEMDTPDYAREWLAMGAEEDSAVLAYGFRKCRPGNELLWFRLGDVEDIEVLNLWLKEAVDKNQPLLAQKIIKQLRGKRGEVSLTLLNSGLERAKNDDDRPGCTNLWKRILTLETKRQDKPS